MDEIDEVPSGIFVEYIAKGRHLPTLSLRNPPEDIAVRMPVDVFSCEVSRLYGEGLSGGPAPGARRAMTAGAILQEQPLSAGDRLGKVSSRGAVEARWVSGLCE